MLKVPLDVPANYFFGATGLYDRAIIGIIPNKTFRTHADMTTACCVFVVQSGFPSHEIILNPDQLYYNDLKTTKQVMDKFGLAKIFTLHESQIVQAKLEDGAIRDQSDKFTLHIQNRMINQPGQKTADPMEGTLLRDDAEPATWSLAAFTQKLLEDPDWTGFKVRVWAHQHLFEARKGAANHFAGTNLEATYRNHHVVVWVGLTYDEESNLSASHNLCSHDVNNETTVDHLLKLRLSWARLGKFDAERSNDPRIKEMKLKCFKSIGINTQSQINAKHTQWAIATAASQDFFDIVIRVSQQYQQGKVKDQKLVAGSEAKTKSAKKRKSRRQKVCRHAKPDARRLLQRAGLGQEARRLP